MPRPQASLPPNSAVAEAVRKTVQPLIETRSELEGRKEVLEQELAEVRAGITMINRMVASTEQKPAKPSRSISRTSSRIVNAQRVKDETRDMVLDLMKKTKEASAPAMAQESGIPQKTISSAIQDLRDRGLVELDRYDKEPGQRGIGRPIYKLVTA